MAEGRILIVDDEVEICSTLNQILKDEGYETTSVYNGEEALKLIEREAFDVVLLDIWLGGRDGIEVLKQIKSLGRDEEVIMISGHATIEVAVSATRLGAFDFLEKPLTLERTILIVHHAIEKKRLNEKKEALESSGKKLSEILGESNPILKLKEDIRTAGPTSGWVLILGENGTGKELVARSIHVLSQRAGEPFIDVNCAAIPSELIESELFGHKKGSFTGATENKKGKFLLAHRGTLFLDEIADMAISTQSKVLRALEEQSFQPVGGLETIRVDARIVAATNRNPVEEIKKGRFREDLYYRLNVIPLYVPPLRERKEDIKLLANHFLKMFCEEHGRSPKILNDNALKAMENYPWRGNVRELKNLMERVAIMVRSDIVDIDALNLIDSGESATLTLREARLAFEKKHIQSVLSKLNFNVNKAAMMLGVERTHLYRLINTLGLKKENKNGND